MTLTTPYSATFIVGDGETKTFSYLFEEVSPNFISVMVYNSVTGLISTPTYVIDTDQKLGECKDTTVLIICKKLKKKTITFDASGHYSRIFPIFTYPKVHFGLHSTENTETLNFY